IARGNFFNGEQNSRIASNTLSQDEYYQYLNNQQELNFVGSLDYTTKIQDFDIAAAVFIENRRNKRTYTDARTAGGLAVPDLYTPSASNTRTTLISFLSDYKVNYLDGCITLRFLDFLVIEDNARNDWSSSVPKKKNSYLSG